MISCDTESIRREYDILLNELYLYNPELLDKPRLLAITKTDLIDADIQEMLRAEIPPGIPYVFISAVAGKGLDQLKDMLWESISSLHV
jgi:GTP-binding protein